MTQLIEKHAERLLMTSFDAMADAFMLADLANLYSLLTSVGKIEPLKRYWATYIKKVGILLVQVPELDVSLVSELLMLKQRLDDIMKSTFQSNNILAHALRDSFEIFVNTRRNKPAQLTAKFIDQCMRSGNKLATDKDIDSLLDRVVMLFRFINDKDLFEAYYKCDLAKRLLYNKSVSIDTERSMVQKLRIEYGLGYTKWLEGMLHDMDVSSGLDGKFTNLQQAQETRGIDFHATILTQAFWPTYEPLPLVIPREVELAQEQFIQFYNEKHNGRKLFWQPNLGTCLLKVVFDEGVKKPSLTIMQGTVLLLFSECDKLSYERIQENTGLEGIELIRTLQPLACGKFRILTKEPKGRDVEVTDVFRFNAAFKSSEGEHVQFNRMYQVDAAIVRILKARKQADHPTLMSELPGQLKFNSTATEIKEHIETLIERDYLKRDETDPSIYHYLS